MPRAQSVTEREAQGASEDAAGQLLLGVGAGSLSVSGRLAGASSLVPKAAHTKWSRVRRAGTVTGWGLNWPVSPPRTRTMRAWGAKDAGPVSPGELLFASDSTVRFNDCAAQCSVLLDAKLAESEQASKHALAYYAAALRMLNAARRILAGMARGPGIR